MILDCTNFIFDPPASLSRARRILIKPAAASGLTYPYSVSHRMMESLVHGIRRISDADILILEGTSQDRHMVSVFKDLKYEFPRVLLMDVRDTTMVEVDNPLLKPLVMPTFLVPNVILSSDYLISVAPLKVVAGQGYFSIANLLSLLHGVRQGAEAQGEWEVLLKQEKPRILADLYYTMPFDLGIIEAAEKLICKSEAGPGEVESYGKIFIGEPYQVDREAAQTLGVKTEYLKLIDEARADLDI